MAETAAQVYDRISSTADADGRLPAPGSTAGEIFPWEALDGGIRPKVLAPPRVERPRRGEAGQPCPVCDIGPQRDRVVWEDEHWVLTHPGAPSGLPIVLLLGSRSHLDFGELDDELASQFGRISNRLVRIIEALPNIGRAHTARWGDGNAHLHVWFFGRTAGLPGVLGSPAAEWDDIIPPGPEEIWRTDLQAVATKLAAWGGTPRI